MAWFPAVGIIGLPFDLGNHPLQIIGLPNVFTVKIRGSLLGLTEGHQPFINSFHLKSNEAMNLDIRNFILCCPGIQGGALDV
jgi:hypothetical protein